MGFAMETLRKTQMEKGSLRQKTTAMVTRNMKATTNKIMKRRSSVMKWRLVR